METVIWTVQGLLAAAFAIVGLAKMAYSKEKLAASGQAWVEDFDNWQVKGIGALGLLAAVGLILPAALDMVPILTALGASGVVLLMLGAGATHVRRGERRCCPSKSRSGPGAVHCHQAPRVSCSREFGCRAARADTAASSPAALPSRRPVSLLEGARDTCTDRDGDLGRNSPKAVPREAPLNRDVGFALD